MGELNSNFFESKLSHWLLLPKGIIVISNDKRNFSLFASFQAGGAVEKERLPPSVTKKKKRKTAPRIQIHFCFTVSKTQTKIPLFLFEITEMPLRGMLQWVLTGPCCDLTCMEGYIIMRGHILYFIIIIGDLHTRQPNHYAPFLLFVLGLIHLQGGKRVWKQIRTWKKETLVLIEHYYFPLPHV